MDEVEVQVLQLQVLQRFQEGWLHVVWVMAGVPQFGCDEHVLSSQRLVSRMTLRMRVFFYFSYWISKTVTHLFCLGRR